MSRPEAWTHPDDQPIRLRSADLHGLVRPESRPARVLPGNARRSRLPAAGIHERPARDHPRQPHRLGGRRTAITMGPKTGMAQLPYARLPFGKSIVLPAGINFLACIAWDAVDSIFGAAAISSAHRRCRSSSASPSSSSRRPSSGSPAMRRSTRSRSGCRSFSPRCSWRSRSACSTSAARARRTASREPINWERSSP